MATLRQLAALIAHEAGDHAAQRIEQRLSTECPERFVSVPIQRQQGNSRDVLTRQTIYRRRS